MLSQKQSPKDTVNYLLAVFEMHREVEHLYIRFFCSPCHSNYMTMCLNDLILAEDISKILIRKHFLKENHLGYTRIVNDQAEYIQTVS